MRLSLVLPRRTHKNSTIIQSLYLERSQRTIESPELFDRLPLHRAPLGRDGSLVLRAGIAHHLSWNVEILGHAANGAHLPQKHKGVAARNQGYTGAGKK